MASRFQKKSTPKIPSIAGTNASLFNYQLLTSTGVPGIDHLLGGGLPVGTVALLQDISHQNFDDSGQNYSQLLVQYFLAEGFFHGHKLFHGQANVGNIQLPAIVSSNNENVSRNKKQGGKENDQLKIAWRYENQTPKNEEFSKVTNHHFNLNKTISHDALKDVITNWFFEPSLLDEGNYYHRLFADVEQTAKAFKIDPKNPGTNLLRIGISDIGSALLSSSNDDSSLMLFLYRLRSLARSHLILIVLTLSTDFFVKHEIEGFSHQKLTELVDFVFDLTAFGKKERENGLFKDHHGLIELVKAAPLNCLQNSHVSIGTKHLFKSLRTKFSVSPMHLPPDLEESKTTKAMKNLEF